MPNMPLPIETLMSFFVDADGVQRKNIAQDFDDATLTEIGTTVYDEYEIDKRSRDQWEKEHKEIFELVDQISKSSNKDGSDVKYPILATAALQFSARAYPNIVKGADVVKCQVVGSDVGGIKAAKGKRVKQHMGYQVLEQMDSWEEQMDQGLMTVALVGTIFKKTYRDTVDGKNVSELVFPKDLVVHYMAVSLEKARRATHVIELYENDIVERVRSGNWLEFDFKSANPERKDEDEETDQDDEDAPYTFLEQHRYWDLDGDGYKEPYVMTIHRETKQVVRIVPRFDGSEIKFNEFGEISKITPVQYFTQFTFLPAFDGNFYKMGFGSLLFAPVNIVDTLFNQLLDAGTLANRQGGFIGKDVKLKKGGGHGTVTFQQGEWKQVGFLGDDIRKQIFALPVREPSNVLFQLLGLMMEGVKELASQADVLTGEHPKGNVPATTTLALIEQGLKVFSAIYKRVYLSLKKEFKKIRRLNFHYLSIEEYNAIIDYTEMIPVLDDSGQPVVDPETGEPELQEQQVLIDPKLDYSGIGMDIIPVSGAADVSDTQRTIKAQALLDLRGGGLNDDKIVERYLEALQIPDAQELLPDPNTPPLPDPKIEIEKGKLELKSQELQLRAMELEFKKRESEGKVLNYWGQTIKALADAEAAEAGPQLELYNQFVTMHQAELNFINQMQSSLAKGNQGDT